MIQYSDTNKPNTDTLIGKIKNWYDESKGSVSTWEDKQDKWHKLRMRIKKPKNMPFKGCSNLRMPTLEILIRKIKSGIVNQVFGIRPIVQVIPAPGGQYQIAVKIEKFLDHLIMDVMDVKAKSIMAIDKSLEMGFSLMKPFWRFEVNGRTEKLSLDDISMKEALILFNPNTQEEAIIEGLFRKISVDRHPYVLKHNLKEVERAASEIFSGYPEVELNLRDVNYNFPDVAVCDSGKVFVPPNSGYDPDECEYIIHEYYLPRFAVEQNLFNDKWSGITIEELDKLQDTDIEDSTLDITKDKREGISRLQKDGTIRILECYYREIRHGAPRKYIATIAPDLDIELSKIELPFYSNKFSFVKLFYELIDDRWFSHRGVPELLEDIVKEIDIQHMQKIDYGTQSNRTIFAYRAGQVDRNAMQFAFGQGLPVSSMKDLGDVIKPIQFQNPNISYQYEREQMVLETKATELVGQVDYTLNSMINKRQPKTFGEIDLQARAAQGVFSLDAGMYRMQFQKLFNWIWELWCQYGDDEYEFSYFGQEGFENIRLTKEEVQGKYSITIRANDQNTNPDIKLKKAQQIVMAVSNPIALQAGIIQPQNIYNAYKRFFQDIDVDDWQQIISPPPPPQKPRPEPVPIRASDMTELEQAQAVAQRGIQPDIRGRMARMMKEQEEADWDKFIQNKEVMNKERGKNGEG